MALQLRSLLPKRLSASSPNMIQCGTMHNFMNSSLRYSLFGQGGRYRKPISSMKYCSNGKISYYHQVPSSSCSQLRVQAFHSTAQTFKAGDYSILNLLARDLTWRRSFSTKTKMKFQFKLRTKEVYDAVAWGDRKTTVLCGSKDKSPPTKAINGHVNATVTNASQSIRKATAKASNSVSEIENGAAIKETPVEDSTVKTLAPQSNSKARISKASPSRKKHIVKASKSISECENNTVSEEKVVVDSVKIKSRSSIRKASPTSRKATSKISPSINGIKKDAGCEEKVIECHTETKESAKEKVKRKSTKAPLKKTRKTTTKKKQDADAIPDKLVHMVRGAKKGNTLFRPLYPPSGKSVVIVESLTKAKVIQNYLGDMYEVLPSYGHVRDIAGRSRSVRPDEDFSIVWEVPASAWTILKSIKVALSGAENLILASDPDREGEAIAWHITEMLRQQDALNENVTVARVGFHEITESSIKTALQAPRDIDIDLVNAYLARRALDYLIGFNISPLLWRKLPGCQSAGRVQSAALALICDREMEIEQSNQQEYWTVGVEFCDASSDNMKNRASISSHLTHLNFTKLDQLSVSSRSEAEDIEKQAFSNKFQVKTSKPSKHVKNPPMPYITSTLQQDSANKLHFTAGHTMKLAQKLYEGIKLSDKEATGLITYMRTDGLHVSNDAALDINSLVKERYGVKFSPKNVRTYFKKVKNAQEAHEAIRPTNIRRLPATLEGILDEDSLKLYTLIWTRTVACQMEPAIVDRIQVDIGNAAGDMIFRSAASKVSFSGFQAVYKDREAGVYLSEEKEDDSDESYYEALCELEVKDSLSLSRVHLRQHHTKPPPRFSEGSLVKKLEELGIGRPSTYATILKVLQDRNYVTMISRVLHPEFRGRMVSAYISHHFSEVADLSFTADMETELDNVSAGETEWKGILRDYWARFSKYCDLASKTDNHQVERMLEEKFGYSIFANLENGNRVCPRCSVGTLRFKVSRFGAGYFIGCDEHPKCTFIAGTINSEEDEGVPSEKVEKSFPPKLLGYSPGSNEKIFLKNGPYGYYVQLGDDRKGYSPKRASVSEVKDKETVTLEDAIELLQYPKTLGNHPEDEHPVLLKISKSGYSVKHRRTVAPVPKNVDPKKITLEAGLKLLFSKSAKMSGRPKRKPKAEEESFKI